MTALEGGTFPNDSCGFKLPSSERTDTTDGTTVVSGVPPGGLESAEETTEEGPPVYGFAVSEGVSFVSKTSTSAHRVPAETPKRFNPGRGG